MTSSQPLSTDASRMCCSRGDSEKYANYCQQYEPTSLDDGTPHPHYFHGNCHRQRLRRVLIPILTSLLVAFLLLCAMDAVKAVYFAGVDGEANTGGWFAIVDNGFKIAKRATDGTTGNSNAFIHNKLYLIVIFVGLAAVVILGIMLTFCCCRASFDNPLCCPCYLCACCGGLACLECIGCGLCAAAVDPM